MTPVIDGVRGLKTATILAGATGLSDVVDLGGYRLVGIEMPAAWTAANLTFQALSSQFNTYQNLYDDGGTEVTVTAAASRNIGFRSDLTLLLMSYRFIKLRSGTTGSPVDQTATRLLGLVLIPA